MTTRPSHSRRSVLRSAGVAAAGAAVAALGGTTAASASARRAQRVIVFTKTNGYRHESIPDAITALTQLGTANGIGVTATEDPGIFTGAILREYTAIVFACTQGNVLTGPARAAIENFITEGGGWMGIHSAADTEYDWAFYTRLLSGGRFLCHPLANQNGRVIRVSAANISTARLPAVWPISDDEFYSFKEDVRGTADVLLRMDESSYHPDPNTAMLPPPPPSVTPETLVPTAVSELTAPRVISGRMGYHPMCWQAQIGNGFSWYTALGHQPAMYSGTLFRQHLLGGLLMVSRHGQRYLSA